MPVHQINCARPDAVGDVTHNEARNRFELAVDGQLAHADYRRAGDTLVFYNTYVPESLRGRGYAAQVVRAGLAYARRNGFDIDPQCSYVASFMQRHPEYAAGQ